MDAISLLALAKASKGGGGGSTPSLTIYTLSDTLQTNLNTAIQGCIQTILTSGDTDAMDTSVSVPLSDQFKIGQGVDDWMAGTAIPCYVALGTTFLPAAGTRVGANYFHIVMSLPLYAVNISNTDIYFSINMIVTNSNIVLHVHKAI